MTQEGAKTKRWTKRKRISLSILGVLLLASGGFTGYRLWQGYNAYRCVQDYGKGLNRILQNKSNLFGFKRETPPITFTEESFNQALRDVEDLERAIKDGLVPLPIKDNSIYKYPGLFDDSSNQEYCPPINPTCMEIPQPIQDIEGMANIVGTAQSVGRLALYPAPNLTYRDGTLFSPYFWGTATVAWTSNDLNIVATSCHEIESLIYKDTNGNWRLTSDPEWTLGVNFGFTTDDLSSQYYQVSDFLGCADDDGIDIAFLSVEVPPGQPLPPQIRPYTGDYSELIDGSVPLALVGYADLYHFVDQNAEMLYRAFERSADQDCIGCDKFAILDFIAHIDQCSKNHNLLDVASTTEGESGGVIVDPRDGTVVGMHICCSEFFREPKGEAPESDVPCARVTRTFHNRAVTVAKIESLLQQIIGKTAANQAKRHK